MHIIDLKSLRYDMEYQNLKEESYLKEIYEENYMFLPTTLE